MNESTNPLETLQIDRLIDGELDANARRELHLQAEETTGAWRQIALAFIEAQHWQGSFSQLLTEPVASPAVVSASPVKSRLVPVMVWGVVAASLLLLVGGMSFQIGKQKGNNSSFSNIRKQIIRLMTLRFKQNQKSITSQPSTNQKRRCFSFNIPKQERLQNRSQ